MVINQNKLAKEITLTIQDKMPDQVNIAQVKEVLACALDKLALNFKRSEVIALLEKRG